MKRIIFTLGIVSILLVSCGTSSIKQPEYRDIRNVQLIELGILQSTAGVDFVFYNPNNTSVQLTEAYGDLYIDNSYFGRFQLDEKVKVGRNSEFVIPATVKVDMIGAVKNQRELLKKKEALVRIEGTARVKKAGVSRDVPLRYESMENIERLRTILSK